jgi:lysophospholipid acyltransferase (LPLAT)-like uncharacterized protein
MEQENRAVSTHGRPRRARFSRRVLQDPRVQGLLGLVVAWLLRLFGATWRIRFEGADPFAGGEAFVAATWHRNLLVAAFAFRNRGVAVPVSRSRDGDLTAAVLQRLGFAPPPRGSSSRGATALLRELIRCIQRGRVVAILPDGPRGPAFRAKPGVLALARATGRPVHTVGIAARPRLRFGSWDRAMLPLPFARVIVAYGDRVHVPKSTRAEALEARRLELERELDRLTGTLDARLGLPEAAGPPVCKR